MRHVSGQPQESLHTLEPSKFLGIPDGLEDSPSFRIGRQAASSQVQNRVCPFSFTNAPSALQTRHAGLWAKPGSEGVSACERVD